MKRGSDSSVREEEFNALLERYDLFLRNTIARICPRDLGIQFADIHQEARIQLWRALESEREIHHPGSYIFRIAVSVTLKAIRRARARREEQLRAEREDEEIATPIEALIADPDQSPDAIAERHELMKKVDTAMERLQEKRRIAVGLYLKGMTTQEIGELMDWSEPKARNLAYRGLKDLRKELRALGVEYGE